MPNNRKNSPDHYNDPLPSRLRKLIKDHNITQDQLSKAVGVSRGSIGQYVNGDSTPKYDALIAIAKYFNVSTDYLLGITDIAFANINVRAICEQTNLNSLSYGALSSLPDSVSAFGTVSKLDDIKLTLNYFISELCKDPALLDNLSVFSGKNDEIVVSTQMYIENISEQGDCDYHPEFGGALVVDPDGDDMALLRYRISRSLERIVDDITQESTARDAAAGFKRAHPERFWKDADGNIAGPIWYVPARSGAGCYPAHMTFAQYEAEIKAELDGDIVKEPYNAQLVKLFEDAAIKHEYNGDIEQFKADQQARSDARKKRLNNGIFPEENE